METSLDVLDLTVLVLAASSLGATFALHWAMHRTLQTPAASGCWQPAISILKPLCGVDEGLYENLVSFVQQSYPEFELLLSVADPRDPALGVVQRLRRAYPEAPVRVIIHGEEDLLANPKVISLVHMARAARYEHLLVSDSNVRVTPNYLAAMAAEMNDPNVGLVSNLIVGSGEDSLGAQCENLHLNTFVLGGVCVAAIADRPCVVGKSMLMRRGQLATLGGFDAMRDVLAEDFLLGQRFHAAGYRVVLSCHAIATFNRRLPVRRFLARHLRWAQLRRSCAFGPFCSEALLYATPWLLAPLWVIEAEGLWLPCALALVARIASDGLMAKSVSGRWPSAAALLLLPVKDTLLMGIWTVALWRRSVVWRGHALRIGPGSRLIPGQPERISLLRPRTATAAN
jgi:ceramide glucosyltransferase